MTQASLPRPAVFGLIAAAGQGTRLGAQVPKAYVELAGRTLLERSVKLLADSGVVDHLVVLVDPVMEDTARDILAGWPVTFVHGGGERADSVWAGLKAIEASSAADAVVLIHDAARALTPPEMVARVAQAVIDGAPAAIPVLPVADTIKTVRDNSGAQFVEATLNRAQLRAVQTPQAFNLQALCAANRDYFARRPDFVATDDASLMEWHGQPVTTVPGDPLAFKITTPLDLALARALTQEEKR